MAKSLSVISPALLKQYSEDCLVDWAKVSNVLKQRSEFRVDDFEFYIIASSVFSSKIEGNSLDLNSFMNDRRRKPTAQKKEFREIEDLANAYRFAANNKLDETNFRAAHALLAETILKKRERGQYRKSRVGVFDHSTGRPVYLAVEPELVVEEVTKLMGDVALLIEETLSEQETFYYASMIHLWVAMIHPFSDGNGRIARLAEKWFLASRLGAAAWSINTEKFYWDHRAEYYRNIALGYNYYDLKWERSMAFLLMLPGALQEVM